jgi:hypothetical protein
MRHSDVLFRLGTSHFCWLTKKQFSGRFLRFRSYQSHAMRNKTKKKKIREKLGFGWDHSNSSMYLSPGSLPATAIRPDVSQWTGSGRTTCRERAKSSRNRRPSSCPSSRWQHLWRYSPSTGLSDICGILSTGDRNRFLVAPSFEQTNGSLRFIMESVSIAI